MSDDEFSPVANGYDPARVYTASRDGKGFSSQIRLRVPPDLLDELGALIASREIPEYRTVMDFMRNAIVHQLHNDADRVQSGRFKEFAGEFEIVARAETYRTTEERRNQLVRDAEKMGYEARVDYTKTPTYRSFLDDAITSLPDCSQKSVIQRLRDTAY